MSYLIKKGATAKAALASILLLVVIFQWSQTAWIYTKAELAQHLIQSAWSQTLIAPKEKHLPWQWADTWPVLRMQWQDSQSTREEDLYVLAGVNGSSLPFGPAHMDGTAQIGQGTTVIAGHRDTHFTFLENLNVGEKVSFQNAQGVWFEYKVDDIRVVDSETTPLYVDLSKDAVVFITCYPFDSINPGGTLRYIVSALPV